MASSTSIANLNRIRRKPAPSIPADLAQIADDEHASVFDCFATPQKRHSFTLYPAVLPDTASIAPSVSHRSHSSTDFSFETHLHGTSPSRAGSPHYVTRRRAESTAPLHTDLPSCPPSTETPAFPAPRPSFLSRLNLFSAAAAATTTPAPVRVRKDTISAPRSTSLASLPAGMVPPELAALSGRPPIAMRELKLPVPARSGSRSSSASDSTRASSSDDSAEFDTDVTSPPTSPTSPLSLVPKHPCDDGLPTLNFLPPTPPSGFIGARRSVIRKPSALSQPEMVQSSASISEQLPSSTMTLPQASLPVRSISLPHLMATPSHLSASASSTRSSKHGKRKPAPLPALSTPTKESLVSALSREVVDSRGVRIPFGQLLGLDEVGDGVNVQIEEGSSTRGNGKHIHRTLVIFLRHFWCPLCTDYVAALAGGVRKVAEDEACSCKKPGALGVSNSEAYLASVVRFSLSAEGRSDCGEGASSEGTNAEGNAHWAAKACGGIFGKERLGSDEETAQTHIVLIAPGAHTIAKRWLQSFDFPQAAVQSVRLFVDPRPAEGLYAALGMGWADVSMNPDPEADPESYITHGLMGGVGAVVMRAVRAGVPLWAKGGDIGLLGGEFAFECVQTSPPTLRCVYAHRMQSPRGHAAVETVLSKVGVSVSPEEKLPRSMAARNLSTSSLPRSSSSGLLRTLLGSSTSTSSFTPEIDVPRSSSAGTGGRGFLARLALKSGGGLRMARSFSSPAGRPLVQPQQPQQQQQQHSKTVSVIWEEPDGELTRSKSRVPAIPPTLSTSSSRPWASDSMEEFPCENESDEASHGHNDGWEHVWMRARARSLARLKARKDARRGVQM
ncbi:unnamed protein product [Mycena citricolor]|uniref:Uncharacterized protein n=1 Tax=Mycena citricolor TaxID=2018698 RepID=A0AAD2H303_9AGAR|nr:unnamed protein product [Mycena citricolor]CAK5269459.1 unnamed protein product [Mycena citricolor]